MHCAALSNLLCRSTSIVLIKPFQSSFFLQPLTKKLLALLWAPLIGMALLRKLGTLSPLYGHHLQEQQSFFQLLWLLRLYSVFPCSHFLHSTHHNNHFWKVVYCGSKFVRAQNCVTDSELSSASWLAAWLPAGAGSVGWLSPVELACLPLCVRFICYSVRPLFLNCSFLFHEERNKIRRRNWSASSIPFLIVWTQIKSLKSLPSFFSSFI